MTDAPKLLLAHHLKTLKLPTVLREYDKVAQQCASLPVDAPAEHLLAFALRKFDPIDQFGESRIGS
jgi:hypothetical protein